MIRMPVGDIRVMGRATQGVRVIRITEGDEIADVAVVHDNGGDVEEEGNGAPGDAMIPENGES